MSDQLRKGLEGLLTAVFPVDWDKFRTYQPDLDERWCQYAEGVIKSKLEAKLARTGPPPVVCESCKGTNTERYEIAGGLKTYVCRDCGWHYELRGATPEPPAPLRTPGEEAWLDELEGCDTRDRRRTWLRAYRANLLRQPPAPDALRTWITGAQFMVTPKEAPDGNAPLHVVTVEGLLKWLDERERA